MFAPTLNAKSKELNVIEGDFGCSLAILEA